MEDEIVEEVIEEEIVEEEIVEEVVDTKKTAKKAPAKSKEKTFTAKELQAEIKKATLELVLEQENATRVSKLSDAEKKKELENEYKAKLSKKEKDLTSKEIMLEINEALRETGVDNSIKGILDVNKYFDSEDKANDIREDVAKVKDLIDSLSNAKIEAFKKEYLRGVSPKNTTTTTSNTSMNAKSELELINDLFKAK